MKITAQEEYGLRCLLRFARTGTEAVLTISEIAAAEGLSVPYVAKLLAILRQGGLIESVRGRSGGYRLARHRRRPAWDRSCWSSASRFSTTPAIARGTRARRTMRPVSTGTAALCGPCGVPWKRGCGRRWTGSPWPTFFRTRAEFPRCSGRIWEKSSKKRR